MTAAYMRILIHAVNSSLYPDVDPDPAKWSGPPPGIVTIQSLLYASLATSLFAAFLAMLGKQWISWYLRNRGGSAVDKSRERQWKLDGLEDWYFHLVIGSLSVMLQLALFLLGCALSKYLWTISRTVAVVAIATTLLGAVAYLCFTLAATWFYNCPYQTPASLIIRFLLSRRYAEPTLPSIPLVTIPRYPVKELRRLIRSFRSGMRSAARWMGCAVSVQSETPHVPLAAVVLPVRVFEDTPLDWASSRADTRCVAWVLRSSTDYDMIFSTVRFAADLIWYPEFPGPLSPYILADLFFECLLDRRVVSGKAGYASFIGMTLASVLSVQLSMEPGSKDLDQLCQSIVHNVDLSPSSEAAFGLVASVLDFVAQTPVPMANGGSLGAKINSPPSDLPVTFKLWLGRIILQTVWRWRRLQYNTTTIDFTWIVLTYKDLMAKGDQIPAVFSTISVLTLAICLGATIDIYDLYPPNNEYVPPASYLHIASTRTSHALFTALDCLRKQLITIIKAGNAENVPSGIISSTLSTLSDLNVSRVANIQDACISWIDEIFNSTYLEGEQYSMASSAVALLGARFDPPPPPSIEFTSDDRATAVRPLLDYLLLSEGHRPTESPQDLEAIALQAIYATAEHKYFDPKALDVLAHTLPTHRLRSLALGLFQQPGFEWWSLPADVIADVDRASLLEAVGDPFQFDTPDPTPQGRGPIAATSYEPMRTITLFIEFTSSDLWKGHLRHSNFASCEEKVSTQEGRGTAFGYMDERKSIRAGPFNSTASLILAAKRLEELGCWDTAEVVMAWAWINHDANHGAHEHTRREALIHRHLRGMQRRGAFSGRIQTNAYQPVRVLGGSSLAVQMNVDLTRIAQACHLKRLYQLFGCDSTRWEVGVGTMDDVALGLNGAGQTPP